MRRAPAGRRERGGALIIIAALLLLGVAWGAMSALSRGSAPTRAEREVKTGAALQAAKQALLSYMVQHAARASTGVPGQLPCPESLSYVGGASEGDEDPACSTFVGRLPWRTLGIDQPRDGSGEPLWYALSPAFRAAPLNFSTNGSLAFTSGGTTTNVVALIIAPGAPLSTASLGGTPPAGCSAVNQPSATRNQAPLDAARFLECGNESSSFQHLGLSDWTNDRVIAVTQAEWVAALAPVIGDRLQREVAPALNEWRTANGWGASWLPYASLFNDPATNDRCGNYGVREGIAPTVGASDITCTGWTGGNVSALLSLLVGSSCVSNPTEMVCTFSGLTFAVGGALFSARVTATAPRVAGSFRKPITLADIQVAPAAGTTVSNFSLSVSPATGDATIQFDVSRDLLFLALVDFTIRIPQLPNADLMADARVAWFLNNNWDRHTYYAVAPDSVVNPVGSCVAIGDPACMEARGLAATSGNYWDKRLVLALMGPALPTQNRSGAGADLLANYLEEHNATTGDRVFRAAFHTTNPSPSLETPAVNPPYPAFNDRLAACPFKHVDQAGADVPICN